MQLSMALLAITGEPKYADAIERLVYNHLLGAQAADGRDWCYFTEIVGSKQFTQSVNCCHSSGPRGTAMIPTLFYATGEKRVRINLYGQSRFKGDVSGVGPVEIRQQTKYPADGKIVIDVRTANPANFRLELRMPQWSKNCKLTINEQPSEAKPGELAVLDREWRAGDKVMLDLDVAPQWIRGTGEHQDKMAAERGPFVLCASPRWNPGIPSPRLIGIPDLPVFEAAGETPGLADEEPYLSEFPAKLLTPAGVTDALIVLGPFAFVQGENLAVWMRAASALSKIELSLTFDGREKLSRKGGAEGCITDGDATTWRTQNNGMLRKKDWWEVTVKQPVEARRLVFRHGHVYRDGGWFDTSEGKPEVLVCTEPDGEWKPVGKLETYPQTTADKPPQLSDGQPFELVIPPTKIYGVRVEGKPACGEKPEQSYSSCAELAAFGK
jgi:hypothetical protein